MTNRSELAKFNNQRLPVEGVLIDIERPNSKNRHRAGLIFGSVKLPHHNIELDHIVIAVPESFINRHDCVLFEKYAFTAEVGTYYKRKRFQNMYANTKAYHLQKINNNKFRKIAPEKPKEFSKYIISRLNTFHRKAPNINIDKLNAILLDKVEGERERYINKLSIAMTKKTMTHADIEKELYE